MEMQNEHSSQHAVAFLRVIAKEDIHLRLSVPQQIKRLVRAFVSSAAHCTASSRRPSMLT